MPPYDSSINEVMTISTDTKTTCGDVEPLKDVPMTSISSMFALSQQKNHTDDIDREKYFAHMPYLRSYGRPDIRREPRRYFSWTLSRWLLLATSALLLTYGLIFFIGSIVTYARGYIRALVIIVINRDILHVTFVASFFCIMTSATGLYGVIYKDRNLLGVYALLLWVCFALISAVGYLGYKADTWNLRKQLGTRWRHNLTPEDHISLQDTLHCCGFESPSDHATLSDRCWAQSLLPGCSYKLYLFEHHFLVTTWTVAFSLIPAHVFVMIVSLLCSNHVDHLFGTRTRPPIAYLGHFTDWREWEEHQKVIEENLKDGADNMPNPITDVAVTRARSTANNFQPKQRVATNPNKHHG